MNVLKNVPGAIHSSLVNKICPRFAAHDPIRQSTLYFSCKRGECSLWVHGMCADVVAAKALDRIAQALEKRELKGK